MYYSDTQITILQSLAKYKFLTVSQIDRLQIVKHKVSIYRILKQLKSASKPLIGYQNFHFHPKVGKLEQLHYLSKYGQKFLIEELYMDSEEIKMPTSQVFINQDYWHRLWCIDFYISIDTYLHAHNGRIEYFDFYFDKVKKKSTTNYAVAKNRIDIQAHNKFIIPDGVLKCWYNQRQYLYLFEQHNGKDSTKIMTQVIQHCLILQEGAAMKKYNFNRNNRVVIVFEHSQTKQALIKQALKHHFLEKFQNFFLLASYQDIVEVFPIQWSNLYGDQVDFF